ncbi:MAG TPA: sigma-70 family RNA polymerase sigma factor [Micromonosporaceae bacterium]
MTLAPAPPGGSATDEVTRWALLAQQGDPVAAAAFIRATQAEVWRFVASLVDPGSADDLTQETYLRAFRALPRFEARASARTWLLGIARRACADHVRTVVRRRRLLAQVASWGDEQAPAADAATMSAGTLQLLDQLNPGQREAFVLTQLLGLSYEEAAVTLDVPIGTIRSRVARARSQLVQLVTAAMAG